MRDRETEASSLDGASGTVAVRHSEWSEHNHLQHGLQPTRKPLQIVGVGSLLEASVALKHGADGIWLSSLCVSLSDVLPDEDVMSVDRIIREVVGLRRIFAGPILIDGGIGGELPRLALLARACEASGASAICIEDGRPPKRNSLNGVHSGVQTIEQFNARLRMLARLRTRREFGIIARTEGLLAGLSVEETVARAEEYVAQGISGLFVHASRREQVIQFADQWRHAVPLLVCPTRYPELSSEEAAAHGIAMILYANQGMRASYKALNKVFAALLRAGSAGGIESMIAPFDALMSVPTSQPNGRVDSAYIAQAVTGNAGGVEAGDAHDGVEIVGGEAQVRVG